MLDLDQAVREREPRARPAYSEVLAVVHDVPLGRAGRVGLVSQAGLRRLYSRFDKTALLVFVLAAPTLSAFWWGVLGWLSQIGQPEVGIDGLIARANDDVLMIPAVWAGLLSAFALSRLAMRGLLGRRYPAYRLYRHLGLSFNAPRVASALAVFTAVLALAAVVVLAKNYTAFTQEGIVVEALPGESYSYPYTEIAAVRSVPAAGETPAHYQIEFYDGRVWRSDHGLHNPNAYRDYKYASMAAFMSGRLVTGPDLFDRSRLEKGCASH